MNNADDLAATRTAIEKYDQNIAQRVPSKAITSPAAPRSAPDPTLPTSADFAALRARLAVAGYSLARVFPADGGAPAFLVSRWNLLRELPNLDAVEQFLRQIGGRE